MSYELDPIQHSSNEVLPLSPHSLTPTYLSFESRYTSEADPLALAGHIRSRDGRVTFSFDRELPPQEESLHHLKLTHIEERDSDYLVYAFVDDYGSPTSGKELDNGSSVVLKCTRPGIYPFSGDMEQQHQRKELTMQRYLRNRKFSDDIYGGVCRIVTMPSVDLSTDSYASNASIDSFTDDQSSLIADSKAEYALVMYLRAQHSLRDMLQNRGIRDIDIRSLNRTMMEPIRSPVLPSPIDGKAWGSPQQLERKLRLNLRFIEDVKRENSTAHLFDHEALSSVLHTLETTMLYAVSHPSSAYVHTYFPQRQSTVTEGHGGTHTGNLLFKWLGSGSPIWRRIDCVDYHNPDLYVLDPLNDYAMLPTDIVVRTDAVNTANAMIYEFFTHTGQKGDPAAVAVFDYAVLEKLWVLFYVRFLFDKERTPSALQHHLHYIEQQIPKVQHNSYAFPQAATPTF